jgi:hypothetical protein
VARTAYERHLIKELSKQLLGPEGQALRLGEEGTASRVLGEEVLLDASSPEASEVVILYRDLQRPACRFGWRMDAVEWTSPDRDPLLVSDPDIWTTIMWANFREHIIGSPRGLPKSCLPERITWTG